MPPTLAMAREAFIKGMNRDTVPSERPRLLAVLDTMIAWSVARESKLKFRAEENTKGAVRFDRADSNVVFWSASPRRSESPLLEFGPGACRALNPEEKANVASTLNAHTRETVEPTGRLHIGFGALKNKAASAAVLELMGELLEKKS